LHTQVAVVVELIVLELLAQVAQVAAAQDQ
jgi:hypothetical protein